PSGYPARGTPPDPHAARRPRPSLPRGRRPPPSPVRCLRCPRGPAPPSTRSASCSLLPRHCPGREAPALDLALRMSFWNDRYKTVSDKRVPTGIRGVTVFVIPRRNKPGFGGRSEVEVDSGATGRVTRELSQEGARGGRRPQGEDLRRGRQRQVSSGLQLRKSSPEGDLGRGGGRGEGEGPGGEPQVVEDGPGGGGAGDDGDDAPGAGPGDSRDRHPTQAGGVRCPRPALPARASPGRRAGLPGDHPERPALAGGGNLVPPRPDGCQRRQRRGQCSPALWWSRV